MNKLTAESFGAILKQANLVSKIDFDNKLTIGINGRFGSPEEKFSINFSKAKTRFVWVYIIMLIKMLTFQHNFVSEVCLMDLESREVSLNRNVYDFSIE